LPSPVFLLHSIEVIFVANRSVAYPPSSFFVLCGLVLVAVILYWAQKVLMPVALAMLLAFVLTPAVSGLQRYGLGRVSSVLVVSFLTFSLLGLTGWIISQQLAGIARNLPEYQPTILRKLSSLRSVGEGGVVSRLRDMVDEISRQLIDQGGTREVQDATVPEDEQPGAKSVTTPRKDQALGATPERPLYVNVATSGWSRVLDLAGPAGETLASVFLVVVLTIFMLVQRENLRNRVVRLVGHGRVVPTTRAIDEGSRRISRYLLSLVYLNATFGLLLSVGLFVLGLYGDEPGHPALRTTAVLWGFLAFSLRFIPYLGTWLAAGLLFFFTVATLPGWTLPLVVFGFFLVLELLTANVMEPLLFGHSTGISPLALLLAAAFWLWLWGPVGLLLSTPLTVVLVVIGKYVPQLEFFEVLLGDEPALNDEVKYYQRLVAHDQDEAAELIDEYLQDHDFESLCGEVLLPALIRAKRDHERGDLEAEDLQFVCSATREVLDDAAAAVPERPASGPVVLLGCPARDEGDELALHMFAALLRPLGHRVEVISAAMLTSEVMERVSQECTPLVCIGSLPPGGLAQARYLCKRLKGQCPAARVFVGRWGDTENVERLQRRLKAAGADFVAVSLAESRAQVVPLLQVAAVAPAPAEGPDGRPERELAHTP
jgi:predicted PurR-regulated permease PerM